MLGVIVLGGAPDGYEDLIAGCNDTFPPIDRSGLNAHAHFQPVVETDGPVTPWSNYYIDYAHKLWQ